MIGYFGGRVHVPVINWDTNNQSIWVSHPSQKHLPHDLLFEGELFYIVDFSKEKNEYNELLLGHHTLEGIRDSIEKRLYSKLIVVEVRILNGHVVYMYKCSDESASYFEYHCYKSYYLSKNKFPKTSSVSMYWLVHPDKQDKTITLIRALPRKQNERN